MIHPKIRKHESIQRRTNEVRSTQPERTQQLCKYRDSTQIEERKMTAQNIPHHKHEKHALKRTR